MTLKRKEIKRREGREIKKNLFDSMAPKEN
jgi:hypothetical protein